MIMRAAVGAPLHLYEHASDLDNKQAPYAAIIAHVHNETMVNVAQFGRDGQCFPRTSIPLVPFGEDPPERGPFCVWPPKL